MNADAASERPRLSDELLAACESHLQVELEQLALQREVLTGVHAALLQPHADAFESALARQEEAAAAAERLREQRHELIARLRSSLGPNSRQVPRGDSTGFHRASDERSDVTLSQVVAAAPPEARGRLGELQSRLRTAATEVVYLQRRNSLVIQRALDIFGSLVDRLTDNADTETYTADGRMDASAGGIRLRTEC